MLDSFLKTLVNLEENKKPRGRCLRVWAKNQITFQNLEKMIRMYRRKSLCKIKFLPFYTIFLEICHLFSSRK